MSLMSASQYSESFVDRGRSRRSRPLATLDAAPLPRAVGVTEIGWDPDPVFDCFMSGEFTAIVMGDCSKGLLGQTVQLGGSGSGSVFGNFAVKTQGNRLPGVSHCRVSRMSRWLRRCMKSPSQCPNSFLSATLSER
jgi:hypothetical protein